MASTIKEFLTLSIGAVALYYTGAEKTIEALGKSTPRALGRPGDHA